MHLYDKLLAEFLRKKRGDKTVRAFARKLGLTHGTLHRVENLQQSLTVGKLGQVIEHLGCSVEDVFGHFSTQETMELREKTGKVSKPTSRKSSRNPKA